MGTNSRDEVVNFVYNVVGDDVVAAQIATLIKVADAGDTTDESLKSLAASFKQAASAASLIQNAISQKAGLTELTAQLASAKEGLAKLQSEFDQTDSSSRKVTKAFAEAQNQVASLTAQVNQQQVALAKTEGALAKAGVDTSNLASAYTKVRDQGAAAASQLAEVGAQSAKAALGAGAAASSTKDLGDRAKDSGGLLAELKEHLVEIATAAGVAELAFKAIDFAKAGFSEATEVEASLSRVKALAQGAAADFDQLGEAIETSAQAANVSAATAAAAASALAQQGLNAQAIFQALTPTLLLARDANIEVDQSAAIVADTLKIFGKNASDAADVVDKLVVASKGSKDGLAGMATALQQLGPDAQAIGVDFEHLLGLLSDITQSGLDSGKAIRGLRTVFQDLENPTSKFALALHDLGDSSTDFGAAIDTLRAAGDKGQEALLTLDGAARSLVLFLVQQAPGALDGFVAALGRAQGAALQTRKAIDDNLQGAFTAFENSLDSIGKGLADSTLAPLREELQSLADRLNAFAASPAFAQLKASLTDLFTEGTKAFDTFIKNVDWPGFVKTIQDGITTASKTIADFKDDVAGVATALNAIGAGIGIFTRGIAIAFDALKVGVSQSVAVVAELAAKFSQVQDTLTNGGFESGATRVLLSIRDAAEKAANDGAGALAENLQKLGENLAIVGSGGNAAAGKIEAVGDAAQRANDAVSETASSADQLGQGFNSVTGQIDDITTALGILTPSLNLEAIAQGAAKTAATEHAEAIVRATAAVATAKDALDKLVTSGNASADAMNKASLDYKKAQDALNELTGTTRQGVDAQNALKQAFAGLGIQSQQALEDAAKNAKTNLDTIVDAFRNNQATIEDVRRAYVAYGDAEHKAFADSSGDVKDQVDANLKLLASTLGIPDAFKDAGDAGDTAGKKIKASMDDAKTSVDSTTGSVKKLKDTTDQASDSADAFNTASQAWGDSLAAAATKAASAAEGIRVLTVDQINLLTELGKELTSGKFTLADYESRLQEIFTGTSEALQQQLEQLREFQNELLDAQSQLADAQGNEVQVENLRHQQRLDDLENEFEVEHKLTSAQYAELKRLEDELHEQKLKNLQDENQATGSGGASLGGDKQAPSSNAPAPSPSESPIAPLTSTVNVHVQGSVIGAGSTADIAKQLAKLLYPEIVKIQRRSS